MPSYKPGKNGLNNVTLDDGTTLPMAYDGDALAGMGVQAAPEDIGAGPQGGQLDAYQLAAQAPGAPRPTPADVHPGRLGAPATGLAAFDGVTGGGDPADPSAPADAPPGAPRQMFDPNAKAPAQGGPGGAPQAPQYAPAKLIKGKMTPSSETVETGPEWKQEGLDLADAAFQKERDAVAAKAEADTARSKLQTEAAEAEAETLANHNIDSKLRRLEMGDREAKLMAERDAQRAQRAQKVAEGGPSRFFKNIGTGGTILAALVSGAGAFAASLSGGKNYAGEAIQSAIERDMQSQRDEIAALDGDLEASNNSLADLYRQYNDREEAEREFLITGLDAAKKQNESLMGKVQDPEQRASMMAAQADIDMRQGKLKGENGGVISRRAASVMTPDRVVGGAPSLQQQLSDAKAAHELNLLRNGGAPGGASLPATAKDRIASVQAARDSLLQQQATDEAAGFPNTAMPWNLGIGRDLEAQSNALIPGLGRAKEGNAPNQGTMDADRDALNSAFGEKRKLGYRAQLEQLDRIEAAARAAAAGEAAK